MIIFRTQSVTAKPAKGATAPVRHALAVAVSDTLKLNAYTKTLDKELNGLISAAIASSDFKGKAGQILSLIVPKHGIYQRIFVIGAGKPASLTYVGVQSFAGNAVAAAQGAGFTHLTIATESLLGLTKLSEVQLAADLGYGAELRHYQFGKYRVRTKDDLLKPLEAITVLTSNPAAAEKAFTPWHHVAESVNFARDIVTEPPNVIYPETLAAACKSLSKVGLKVEVLGEAQMKKLGMGSLLGVGQGSVRESQLVVMQWNGGKKGGKPVAFVGKGVTFDTGGISIKPAQGMEDMKYDMAGSAAVIGLMRALAARKAKVNAVGVVGLVENMPDGNAQRPGDVVTSMSGQTIEVLNTDAEGRLVLADALWYTQDRFKPQFMVNLATLTGAIVVALGSYRAGLFSNNDALAEKLSASGKNTGEQLWRLPLGDEYDKQINSDIADMRNIGEGREAGSVTAAQFLQRFVNDVPWAHLDIAGVAWGRKDQPLAPRGATGYGIRLLNQLVADYYEGK